ncbi:MAG: PD-(D/E)XK nuclease family protein [Clostridia bacterium]|nr:PD-(D/E)XK nuclease family protein [Clostridia bacterium]
MIRIRNVSSLYECLYSAVDYCRDNPNEDIEIIVPDKLSLFMEKFLFEKLNISSSFNLKVSTLNRFAKRNFPIEKSATISKVGSILLIHKIMNQHISELSTLKSRAYSFTYAENIFRTIAQLKASKIIHEEMSEFNSHDEQLKNKIQDLELIYRNYEIEKAGLLDASDLFLMSSFHIADGREGIRLLFVGFDDFTAIEYALIERLAMVAEVNVYTCFTNGNNKHIYNHEIYDQLKKIAFINELPFEVIDEIDCSQDVKQFMHGNIYGLKEECKSIPDDMVRIYSGNEVSSEIEFVARDIREKILLGYNYSNFGVAVYGLDNHLSKIKEIFKKYEINAYFDGEISLNKSIFYKFICSVFKYNFESYNLSHLIDLINSPFFVLGRIEKNKLISRLLDVDFKGKINDRTDLGDEVSDGLSQLREFLALFTFDKTITITEFVDIIKNADRVAKISDRLMSLSDNIADVQYKMILTRSYKLVFELFDEIIRYNQDITIEQFIDIFEHIAGVVKINNLPLTIDAVKVVDADNQMEIFDNLYIINCTAENAPSMKYDCGIILDTEIEKLNFSHKLSPTIAHINRLSKLRLFNLVNMFEDSLTICYSNNPSEIILDINKKLANVNNQSDLNFGTYLALSEWDYVDYLCKKDKNNKKIAKNTLKNKHFSNISTENLKIYDDMNTISASRLESFFDCPFSSFLNHQLKIKPRIDTKIQSFDIGTILHDILYLYYKRDKKVGEVYEFCRDQVFKHFDRDERLRLNADNAIVQNLIEEAVRTIAGVNYLDENSLFQVRKDLLEFDFSKTPLKLDNINIIGKIDRVDQCGDMLRVVDYKSGKANASLKELYYGHKLQLFLYSSAIENVVGDKVVGCFYLPLHNEYMREIGNTYSLNGFYINDNQVIQSFDKRLIPGMKSDIVNVNMLNSGLARTTIGYKEVDSAQMSRLKDYAKRTSIGAVDEIRSGFISPSPSGISKPCDYCPYMQICMRKSEGIDYREDHHIVPDSFKEVEDGGI